MPPGLGATERRWERVGLLRNSGRDQTSANLSTHGMVGGGDGDPQREGVKIGKERSELFRVLT